MSNAKNTAAAKNTEPAEKSDTGLDLTALAKRLDDQEKAMADLKADNEKLKNENKALQGKDTEIADLQSRYDNLEKQVAQIDANTAQNDEAMKNLFQRQRKARLAQISQPAGGKFTAHTASGENLDPKNLPKVETK